MISNNLSNNLLHLLSPSAKLILEVGRKICIEERRPFSFKDFEDKMAYSTFRKNISLLMRKGLIIAAIKSKPRFYWVTDVPMPNALWATNVGMGVGVRSRAALGLLELLERLPVGQRCVHDLRILFKVKGVYDALKCSSVVERVLPRSEDLQLRAIRLGPNRFARVTVHKNDSVSVVIASSLNPYPLSDEGIADLWSDFGKVSYFLEERGAGSIPAGTSVGIVLRSLRFLVKVSK
jgi:hypothetical protein